MKGGVAVVLGGQVAQIAVGVLTSTLIGRTLGPEAYGTLNVLRNALMLAVTLTPLGLDVALLKYLAGEADDPAKRSVIRRLRLIAFTASLALWAAVAGAASQGWIGRLYPLPHLDALATLALAALPFATDLAILGAVYRAQGRVGLYAALGVWAQTGFRLLAVPLALWLAPSVALMAAIGVAQVALSASLLWANGRSSAGAPLIRSDVGRVLAEGRWMALSLFVSALMLGVFAPAREVGAYAAIAMVSQLIAVVPMAFSQTLGPRVASAHASRAPGAVRRELSAYLSVAAPVSAWLFGGIVAFGPRLDLVFGPRYVFDPLVCLLVPLGPLLSAGLGPLGFALSMTGRHREENALLVAGAVALAGGCAYAAPAFGARGVAACVAAVFALVSLARFAAVARWRGGAPGRVRDLVAAPWALALALVCAHAAGRGLPGVALACAAYTALFALAVVPPGSRGARARRWAR
jgi:O-antigen/teichoic acid export membrane protein